MNKTIERQITEIYAKVYKEVFTPSNLLQLRNGDTTSIENALANVEVSQKYNDFAEKFAKVLAEKGLRNKRGVWRKFFEAARSRHYIGLPKTWTAFEAKIMTNAITHNFQMIKSIPQRMKEILHHKYTSELIEEVAKGSLPRGSFAEMLKSHGHKQAQLIARTETAKLQTAITEQRSIDLGSICYRWLASRDKRTRPSHKAMNGVIVFWRPDNERPILDNMQGNAGQFPNCRCDCEPIFDENDLKETSYKVYDYRQFRIITMSRKDLLAAIKRGTL